MDPRSRLRPLLSLHESLAVRGRPKIEPHFYLTPRPQFLRTWLFQWGWRLKTGQGQGGRRLTGWASSEIWTFLHISSFLSVPKIKGNWYHHNFLNALWAFQASWLFKARTLTSPLSRLLLQRNKQETSPCSQAHFSPCRVRVPRVPGSPSHYCMTEGESLDFTETQFLYRWG